MDDEQVHYDVRDALAEALQKHERSMLGRWVVIAESTTEDGVRGVWTLADPDSLAYETIGLLHYALSRPMGDFEAGDDN